MKVSPAVVHIFVRTNAGGRGRGGSPAERAGLEEGDVILAVAGKVVPDIDALHRLLGADRIGTPSELVLLRSYDRLQLEITPAEAK